MELARYAGDTFAGDKSRALMIVIEKMIARHQRAGIQDEGMYKLFEEAKVIACAKNRSEFKSAIANL